MNQDKTVSNTTSEEQQKPHRKAGYIGTIVFTVAFIYVINNLLFWKISWLSPSFANIQWIFNISLGITLIANIVFLIADPLWLKSVGQLAMNIASFAVIFNLYKVFPFITSETTHKTINVILIILMALTALASLVELIKLIIRIIRAIFNPGN
jgi:hypothetical protein